MLENLDARASSRCMRNMLLAMDPPRHVDYRRPLVAELQGQGHRARWRSRSATICRAIMARGRASSATSSSCTTSPSTLPIAGDRRADGAARARTGRASTAGRSATPSGQDPDDRRRRRAEYGDAHVDMAMYAIEFAARRRAEPPREDLTSLILAGDFGGEPDDRHRVRQLLRAARHRGQRHDEDDAVVGPARAARSTPTSSPSCAPTRAHPGRGRGDPALRQPAALLPAHRHRRHRARAASTIARGRQGGDVSTRRPTATKTCSPTPQEFDIHRNPNPHLSFGIAEHFCLGVHLARLEGRVFFEELLDTFPTIELTGEPRRVRSNLNNGLKELPVRLAGLSRTCVNTPRITRSVDAGWCAGAVSR